MRQVFRDGNGDDANDHVLANGTFTINKAVASVSLGNLTQTYGRSVDADGHYQPRGSGDHVDGGAADQRGKLSGAMATVTDANYQGSASGTSTINKAVASVSLGDLTQTYTGSRLTPSADDGAGSLGDDVDGAPADQRGKLSSDGNGR